MEVRWGPCLFTLELVATKLLMEFRDGDPVYSQATSPAVKSWGSAEIVQTDRFSIACRSFRICNEILKYKISNIKISRYTNVEWNIKRNAFSSMPLLVVVSGLFMKTSSLFNVKIYFRSFVFGFPWAFDFFRFGACPLEGEENNFETRADCQKVSSLIGLKRMRKYF